MRWISALLIFILVHFGTAAWSQVVAVPTLKSQWLITEDSREQQAIDETYRRVLQTPSGLSICIIAQGRPELLKHLIGTSQRASFEIAQECLSSAVAKWGGDIMRYRMIQKRLESIMLQRPKKSYFVVPIATYFPHDSWTTFENRTLISQTAFHSSELLPVLIHELQMAFDAKDTLSGNNIEVLKEGWTALSRNFFKPSVDRDVREAFEVIHTSPLRRLFAIIRSFSYEAAVISELQSDVQDFQIYILSNQTCIENVEKLILHFRGESTAEEMKQVRSAWKHVKESHLGFEYPARGIGEISLCQFMAIPAFEVNMHLTSGPRPRIRPSTGRETLIKGGFDRASTIKGQR